MRLKWKVRPDAAAPRVLGVAKTTGSYSLRDVYLRRACEATGAPLGLRRDAVDTLIRAGTHDTGSIWLR
jgi:hypothetical protein